MESELGRRLQDAFGSAYRLERELGGGGMSRVFVAAETALGRRVVIKVLAPELAEGLSAERFEREVRLAARLQHPNILPVFTAGTAKGSPFYTMPFVDGESLRARLDRNAGLPTSEAVAILRDIARALAYAHDHGVVHRDVKPENVLVSRDVAVVADFGIAKAIVAAQRRGDADERGTEPTLGTLTMVGMSVGTPAYMAPEQAAGESDVDERADIYAWGIVAHELLGGRHPFAAKRSAQALIAAHFIEMPAPLSESRPDLPTPLVALVTRCLAKERGDRPRSAAEIADILGSLATMTTSAPNPKAASLPSIAVLPFANLSADPENEYFSDGISDDVLSILAQDPGLHVAARSSSFSFRGRSVDLKTIAEQLQVSTLVEGSVRRSGNRVRITAQLVNAVDGYQLWSDRFDRELTDIFAVQDEIAHAIATTLVSRLRASPSGNPSPAVTERRTRQRVNVDAYDEYLKGRHANRHMRGVGHEKGPPHFERALELEPNFAAAHAGLGESYLWLAIFFALPLTEAFARVRRHARRALALDPDLADAHWLLAEVAFWHDWDVDASEEHIRRTLALEPNHANALMTAAICLCAQERQRESIAAADRAVHADPLNLGTRIWFLAITFNADDNDRTIAEATRLIAEQADYSEGYRWRAMAHIIAGNLTQAAEDLERAGRFGARHVWWEVNNAILASQQGRVEETRRVRDDLVRRSATEWVSPVALGQVEQALGDYDAAFTSYERAYEIRDFLMTVLHTDPSFRLVPPMRRDAIVTDPRWANLLHRVGLAG